MSRPPMLSPIRRRSVSEDVLETLRTAILEGQFASGNLLAEAPLAAQLGVSRAPIREAMLQLEREGLLEFTPRGMAQVRSLTMADLEELYTLRVALEPMATRYACRNLTPEDVAILEENISRMRGLGKLLDVSMMDIEFHDLIVRISRHGRLQQCWMSARSQVQLWLARKHSIMTQTPEETLATTLKAHENLVRVLRSGDEEAAEKEARVHVQSWRKWFDGGTGGPHSTI